MQYFTSNANGVSKIHIGDETTGKVVTFWPGAIPGSYNVVNEIVSILPGTNGTNSPYQVYTAFFTLVQREDILGTLQSIQTYFSSF